MRVLYTKHALSDLKQLDKTAAQRIIKKVIFFSQQSDPLQFAKKLTHFTLAPYRFRVGDYRILFDVDKSGHIYIVVILRIKHRKDIYNV